MERVDLLRRFTHHPPVGDKSDNYEIIRHEAFDLSMTINDLSPEGREKSLAITKLEEVVMWANAGIARKEK